MDYGLQYIMDGTGNYYRINAKDQLVVAGGKEDASIFSMFEANQRIGGGKKSKFYVTVPVESDAVEVEKTVDDTYAKVISILNVTEENAKTEMEVDAPPVEAIEEKIVIKDMPAMDYDIESIDWMDYVNLFCYLSNSVSAYRERLNQRQSKVDKELCDLLHYVELYDLSEDETFRAMKMMKEARMRRREIKDKIEQIDAFQRYLGTSANVSRAKGCITDLKKLETRKYFPRELKEMFVDMEGRKTDKSLWRQEEQAVVPLNGNVPEMREAQMEYCKKETIFDNKLNNWLDAVQQQYDFFSNIQQYIINLEIELDELERSIEDSLLQMEDANYNVAQGYKAYKELKDIRKRRKEVLKEYEQLQMMVECFDCGAMADAYGYLVENL